MNLLPRWVRARAQLQAAAGPWALSLAAMLLTLLSLAVLARHQAGPEACVLGAFLPMVAMRVLARASGRSLLRRTALLALAGVMAAELPLLLAQQPALGVAALIALACTALWWQGAGRVGALGAVAATLVVRMALLVPLGGANGLGTRAALAVLVALLACGWVWLLRLAAARWRPAWLVATVANAGRPVAPGRRGVPGLQMGAALLLAWGAGQALAPGHMTWALLSAFLVLEGTSGRREVQHKAGWRVLGATLGTWVAALLSLGLPPASPAAALALLLVFALAGWLRALGNAWWATGITTCLSLLYSLMGADAMALLGDRLVALSAGAAVALLCASLAERWFGPHPCT